MAKWTATGARLAWLTDTRRWLVVVIAVLVAGGGWIWASAAPATGTYSERPPSPREGFMAPDFTLDRLGGGRMTLSDLRGQVVVMNLWASWCPPCRAEMPALQQVYDELRERGMVILAVNVTYQDGEAPAAAFVAEYGLTFPVLLDRTGEVGRGYLLRALPTTFFIDRQGVIRQVIVGGPMSEATIRSAIEPLLEETP